MTPDYLWLQYRSIWPTGPFRWGVRLGRNSMAAVLSIQRVKKNVVIFFKKGKVKKYLLFIDEKKNCKSLM